MRNTTGLSNALEYVRIDGHKMHIFRAGNPDKPKLVFLSGSATAAPMYDFKVLYEKLFRDYRIIVIEKFGYGYSDLYEGACDIDSLVERHRQALEQAEEAGPYVLLPHSMGGLEAIRWSQKFPEEIKAIIGLDMAVPKTYQNWTGEELQRRITAMKKMQKPNSRGLLFWYPLNTRSLSKAEIRAQKQLRRRNFMNDCLIKEAEAVFQNAETAAAGGKISCPVLLFVSDGKQVSANWIQYVNEFAEENNAAVIPLDCGHYIHYYESGLISEKIREFLDRI